MFEISQIHNYKVNQSNKEKEINPPNQTLVEVCLSGIRKLKIKWNQTKNFNSEWEMNELKWISPAARKNREVRMKLK